MKSGDGVHPKTKAATFNAYVNTGGNIIDTANKYTEGTSEKYIGDRQRRTRRSYEW